MRPCALVLPRYREICEARLVSAGFDCAIDLASKIDCCLHMFKHQLSTQIQYSFGVWSAMSIIKRAISLRGEHVLPADSSQSLDESEHSNRDLEYNWLVQAIGDCVKPGLCDCDLSVYPQLIAEV